MVSKLIGVAIILAVGFMILRPKYSRVRHRDHSSDPGSEVHDGKRLYNRGRRDRGCCGR